MPDVDVSGGSSLVQCGGFQLSGAELLYKPAAGFPGLIRQLKIHWFDCPLGGGKFSASQNQQSCLVDSAPNFTLNSLESSSSLPRKSPPSRRTITFINGGCWLRGCCGWPTYL